MFTLTLVYFLSAVGFFLYEPKVFETLTLLPDSFSQLPASSNALGVIFFFGLMINLGLLCFVSGLFPKNWSLQLLHLFSKVSTAGLFIHLFTNGEKYWFYLIGSVADTFLAVVLFVTLIRFSMVKPYKEDKFVPKFPSRSPDVFSSPSRERRDPSSMVNPEMSL